MTREHTAYAVYKDGNLFRIYTRFHDAPYRVSVNSSPFADEYDHTWTWQEVSLLPKGSEFDDKGGKARRRKS